ncbi:MAG: 3-hydroxyacyl-CoA dehydrogenase family protein [Burkholderiaceae bacterium]|nr:3-hydroxyacyl-CoA dehydrogenase family protein [Burkholderiaceae bacterium]
MTDSAQPVAAPIERIAVVGGGGLMGHGIVLACLLGSPASQVRLVARRQETLAHGMDLLRTGPFGMEAAVRKGRLAAEAMEQALARVRPTLDLAEGVRDAQLVFETVPEVVSQKHAVLREIEAAAPTDAIIATNTSSIMIAELSGVLANPGRMLGTHWFYPSNVMPLVEVACADRTEQRVAEAVVRYLASIGKQPVVVRDSPGFFTTRFVNLFIAEAMHAVQEGLCGIRDVDQMVKTGLGWPMGVFELLDKTASFDSWYHAQEYLHETLGERYAIPPIARKVFASGYRGAPNLKPGSRGGWYDYFGVEPQGGKK